jgi:hypothetical protein
VILNLAAGASVVAGAPVGFFDYQDWRGVAAFLAQNATPGDTLLLDPGWSRAGLDYYDHSFLARESMDAGDAVAPKILDYCSAHSAGRKWLIVAVRDSILPSRTATQWKAAQSAQTGVSLKSRLEESGRVSLGPPRLFTGISVYPLSCQH